MQGAAAIDRVIERAEGNAYFAEELLATSSAGSELPTGLADLLVARTVDLSPGRAAGAACGRRYGPADRRRPGHAGDRTADGGLRGGRPGGCRPPAARPRRRQGPGVPARAAARGDLQRPAAGGAQQAARPARRAAVGAGGRIGRGARRALPGQPRHPRRLRGLGERGPGGVAAGGAGGGPPALSTRRCRCGSGCRSRSSSAA